MSTRTKALLAVLLAAGSFSLVYHQVQQKKAAAIEAARLRSEALDQAAQPAGAGAPTDRRTDGPEQEAAPLAGPDGVVGEMPADAGAAVEAPNEPATGP